MACYWGARSCCGKCRWATLFISVLAAVGLLAGSLYRTVPGAIEAGRCVARARGIASLASASGGVTRLSLEEADRLLAQNGPKGCWDRFWARYQIPFILSLAGLLCAFAVLLTLCCFCCADAPPRAPAYYEDDDAGGGGGQQQQWGGAEAGGAYAGAAPLRPQQFAYEPDAVGAPGGAFHYYQAAAADQRPPGAGGGGGGPYGGKPYRY